MYTKRKEPETGGETALRIIVNIGIIGFMFFALAHAYWIPQPCGAIDKEFFYCNFHPIKTIDIIGTILFCLGCIGLSGVWVYFTGYLDEGEGRPLFWASGIAAIGGSLLTLL